MGDIIFGIIIVVIYGLISQHLYHVYKKKGHLCTCKACPVSDFVRKDGKIDLLAAAAAMTKEE